jgi:hypothetical protein
MPEGCWRPSNTSDVCPSLVERGDLSRLQVEREDAVGAARDAWLRHLREIHGLAAGDRDANRSLQATRDDLQLILVGQTDRTAGNPHCGHCDDFRSLHSDLLVARVFAVPVQ